MQLLVLGPDSLTTLAVDDLGNTRKSSATHIDSRPGVVTETEQGSTPLKGANPQPAARAMVTSFGAATGRSARRRLPPLRQRIHRHRPRLFWD